MHHHLKPHWVLHINPHHTHSHLCYLDWGRSGGFDGGDALQMVMELVAQQEGFLQVLLSKAQMGIMVVVDISRWLFQ